MVNSSGRWALVCHRYLVLNSPMYFLRSLFVTALVMAGLIKAAAAEEVLDRRSVMAVENVLLAESLCGVELTPLGRRMIALDKQQSPRPFAEDRSVVANLWRETFKCNPDFAGQNCFAARWQMCQRAYGEYGPNGIMADGLIAAIVKK